MRQINKVKYHSYTNNPTMDFYIHAYSDPNYIAGLYNITMKERQHLDLSVQTLNFISIIYYFIVSDSIEVKDNISKS